MQSSGLQLPITSSFKCQLLHIMLGGEFFPVRSLVARTDNDSVIERIQGI